MKTSWLTFVSAYSANNTISPQPMNTVLADPPVVESPNPAASRPAIEYNVAIGRLRAFVTALVVAHHAVLAYFPWAPPPPGSLDAPMRWWLAFPVVDAKRWMGWALFVGWNDTFFMALMFFLSGLFVWDSLRRKGAGGFAVHRLVRLGLPFVLAAGLLAPLAYYPTYLQTPAEHHDIASFWSQWRALGTWPAGPAWFLWVLLGFGCAAAAFYTVAPHWAESANRFSSPVLRRPAVSAFILILISGAAYVPMAQYYGPIDWKMWGPFYFQTSRIILYAVYFAAGIILGAGPTDQTLLAPDGRLANRWISWCMISVAAFIATTVISMAAMAPNSAPRLIAFLGLAALPVTCAASSFALVAAFVRFAKSRRWVFESFCVAAYGVYLIHYPVVSWAQYALLPWHQSAVLKGVAVTVVGILLSWGLVSLARQVRVVARVI
jgi:peptidoglycan/LPS O-acetylase OafA/YrhL